MTHFVLLYDRNAGRLMEMKEFARRDTAMRARFDAEDRWRMHPQVEVVALAAESKDELMRTHGRYFLGLSELAARMG